MKQKKEGDESITSHPSEPMKPKGGWWEYYLSPFWNMKPKGGWWEYYLSPKWNMKPTWIMANNKHLMHDESIGQKTCHFFVEFAGFFALFYFFWYLWVSCPPGFLQGGAGRAIKSKFERWTLVMRVLPHFCFFSNMTSQSQPTNITARVQLLTACKPLCLKPMRIEL